MFMYEKEGKLNIIFGDNKPAAEDMNPDVVLEKDADGVIILHVGEKEIKSTDAE